MILLKNFLLFSILLFTLHQSTCTPNKSLKVDSSLTKPNAPQALAPIKNGSLFIFWDDVQSAFAYNVKVYNEQIDLLEKQKIFLSDLFVQLTKLEKNNGYRITVSAVYKDELGDFVESEQSEPLYVTSGEVCKGGQELQGCLAHCKATCEIPDPVCDRRCVYGCQCPNDKPFWNGAKCLQSSSCPTTIGSLKRPTNLKAFSDPGSDNVLLMWDAIPGVTDFMVEVMPADDTENVIIQMPVNVNMALIQKLDRGNKYLFRVYTITKIPVSGGNSEVERRMMTPPSRLFIREVNQNSFVAYWVASAEARKYKVKLLSSDLNTVLYVAENVAAPSVLFENLQPNTQYFIRVASAKVQADFGKFSEPLSVRTKSTDEKDESSVILDFGFETTTAEATTKPTTTETTAKPTTTETTAKPTTTETTAKPTTAEATTKSFTLCQQQYMIVAKKAAKNKSISADDYPICAADGTFSTRLCKSFDLSVNCWCIDKHTGVMVQGSQFGVPKLNFIIDCDKFGMFGGKVQGLKADVVRKRFVSFKWDSVPLASGYIVQIYEDYVLLNVINQLEATSAEFKDLKPETEYVIKVIPVDSYGSTGKPSEISIKTLNLVYLSDLEITDNRSENSTLLLKWSGTSSTFKVKLTDCRGKRLLETKTAKQTIELKDLSSLICYKITVRNLKATLLTPLSGKADTLCKTKPIDLIFTFDTSKYGPKNRFLLTREFAQKILSEISFPYTRVAAVKYSSLAEFIFTFTRYQTKEKISSEISKIKLKGGYKSRAGFALNYIDHMFFKYNRRGFAFRQNALKVIVFFSGGVSNDKATENASKLRRMGATIVVVTPNDDASKIIATSITPDTSLQFRGSTQEELNSARNGVTRLLCLPQ